MELAGHEPVGLGPPSLTKTKSPNWDLDLHGRAFTGPGPKFSPRFALRAARSMDRFLIGTRAAGAGTDSQAAPAPARGGDPDGLAEL